MAKILARLLAGSVVELIHEKENIAEEWPEDFLATCVDVTNASPAVQVGWAQQQNGSFAAPAEVTPPPARQMLSALYAGCQIISTGTPSISATYDAVGPRFDQMINEALYITINSKFSGGLSEFDWAAKSGEVIFTSTAELITVSAAIGDWITLWQRYVDGKAEAPPSLPMTVQ